MGSVNFKDALASAIDVTSPVPDNTYDVQVVTAEAGTSKGGKLQFKVNYKVLHGEQANRAITQWITFSPENPQAAGFFFRDLETLGIPKAYFESNPEPSEVARLVTERAPHLKLTVDSTRKGSDPRFTNVTRLAALDANGPAAAAPVAQPAAVANVAAPAPVAPVVVAPAPVAPAPVAAAPVVAPVPVAPVPVPAPAVAPPQAPFEG